MSWSDGSRRQHRQYLYNQLMAFHTGRRSHPPMDFFVRQMSENEVQAITQYYSALRLH
jgi:cytochrome c553